MSANEKQVGGEHYQVRPIQHWDYVITNQMPYLDAQAFKYIDRHARKNGKQDLEKAIHFIEKMIETYYPEPKLQFREDIPQTLCSNASDGVHLMSSVYRHGKDGRMHEIWKCDRCQWESNKD